MVARDRQPIEMRGDALVEAADVFELDVGGGGQARADGMKNGGVFGVLQYDFGYDHGGDTRDAELALPRRLDELGACRQSRSRTPVIRCGTP
jgi:hypothetical protein